MGAELSDEEFLIFMTQDAVPQDQYLIEKADGTFPRPKSRSKLCKAIAG